MQETVNTIEQASYTLPIVLIGVAAIGVFSYLYFRKKRIARMYKERDPERYERNKSIIKKAIQDNDHEALEEMLQSRTRDFPDLIEMIEQALKNKKA